MEKSKTFSAPISALRFFAYSKISQIVERLLHRRYACSLYINDPLCVYRDDLYSVAPFLSYLFVCSTYKLKNAFVPESRFSSTTHCPFFCTTPNPHSFAASNTSSPS